MEYYKVFTRDTNGTLRSASYHIVAPVMYRTFGQTYRKGVRNYVRKKRKGYGICIFDSLQAAKDFMTCIFPPYIKMCIYIVETIGSVWRPRLHTIRYSSSFQGDRVVEWTAKWPDGTLMTKSVKLGEEVL